jgi:hypothetical protein
MRLINQQFEQVSLRCLSGEAEEAEIDQQLKPASRRCLPGGHDIGRGVRQ